MISKRKRMQSEEKRAEKIEKRERMQQVENTMGETREDSRSSNPYEELSPKGKTQVQHFLEVIMGRPEDVRLNGKVQGVTLRIICNMKEKYDAITTGAITAVKNGGGAVRCERTVSALPKTLRKERKVEFSVAYVEIEMHDYFLKINPIIIESNVICITLSGKSTNLMIGTVLCKQGFEGGRIMMERRGRKLLRTWTNEDKEGGGEEPTASGEESIETDGREPELSLEDISQQESEEESDESDEEESNGSEVTVEARPDEGTERNTEANPDSEEEDDDVCMIVQERQAHQEERDNSDEDDETVKNKDLPYAKLKKREEKLEKEVAELEERKRKRDEVLSNIERLRERKRILKKDLREEGH